MIKTSPWLVGASVLLFTARSHGGAPEKKIDFFDDFTNPNLTAWDEDVDCEVTGVNRLVRTTDADTILSFAMVEGSAYGFGHPNNTATDFEYTAAGIDLGSTDRNLRMVTLRVRRGDEIIAGAVRAYWDYDSEALKVRYLLIAWDASGTVIDKNHDLVAGDPTTGDLVLSVTGSGAQLSFAGAASAQIAGLTAATITQCRIELQADLRLGGSPSVDSVTAKNP